MGKVYLISDMHFNHTNILKYENRPFKDVMDMNKTIIKKWNSIVDKDDKVFILGDFGFGDKEILTQIFQKLGGNKVLIMGNHDKRKSIKWWLDIGFKEVYKYPIIYDNHFILSHEPLMNVPESFFNIHGHLHSKTMNEPNKYYNVSVERINFKPINYKIIRNLHYDCKK